MVERQAQLRKDGRLPFLRPDAKSQVTCRYVGGKPHSIDTVVLSTQHSPEVTQEQIRADVMEQVIRATLPAELLDELTRLHELLSSPTSTVTAIPLLQEVVKSSPRRDNGLLHLQPLLMQSAEQLIQDVIRDFAPQITAELEKRLHQHLQQLIREQEQLRLSQQSGTPFQP